MNRYCDLFNMRCEGQRCRMSRSCQLEEWCLARDGDGEGRGEEEGDGEFLCTLRNTTLVLPGGQIYTGSTNQVKPTLLQCQNLSFRTEPAITSSTSFSALQALLPHGWGQQRAGRDGPLIYEGQWAEGAWTGAGTVYHAGSSRPRYIGQFG